jgi:hypothetical protein
MVSFSRSAGEGDGRMRARLSRSSSREGVRVINRMRDYPPRSPAPRPALGSFQNASAVGAIRSFAIFSVNDKA